jgi:hypothetical protein
MGPWVFTVAGAAVLVGLVWSGLTLRSGRRIRAERQAEQQAELQAELVAARGDVQALTERVEALAAEVDQARRAAQQARRREVEPFVITGVVEVPRTEVAPREAQLVRAIEEGRPQWVPARPLHEVLVKSVALGHGVRGALSAEKRDRILLEMRAEVRRSRRQRKAELKAMRKYLRERRKHAA